MTSFLNIMVMVRSEKAMAKMMAVHAAEKKLNAETAAASRLPLLGARHIASLQKFGNQLQWTGRMIQYNFTLPILAAGVAATKWAMDNEAAMTHVSKVYGDVKNAAAQFRAESAAAMSQKEAEAKATAIFTSELESLDEAFTAISNHYGVQKAQVLEVAGAWAAAGASGRDLADSVNETMKAIIIGDMDAAAATKALISIQGQYNLSSAELNATLSKLNSVENQTAVSMSDLIIGFEKAAGVARFAGVDVNHLAAYMAALVPATGSAASAGQALKTIFSRLMGPTKESAQVIKAMGLNIDTMAWQSSTAVERLDLMADKFTHLGGAAQGAASAVIASRWQVNKFNILMEQIAGNTTRYTAALEAAEHQGQNFKRMQKELNTVLSSDPRKLQRMWVMLQNAMTEIIQPLIPFILYLADALAKLAQSFANLDPYTQKLILFGLVFLMLVGPIVKYMGALTTLFWVFGKALYYALVPFIGLTKLMFKATGVVAKFGTLFVDAMILMSGIVRTTLSYIGILFLKSFQTYLKIVVIGLGAQVRVFVTWMGIMWGKMFIFRSKMAILWASTALMTTGIWSRMWIMLSGITTGGFAALRAKFVLFSGLVAIWTTMSKALVFGWTMTWQLIPAISAAGWALLRAQWVVGAITGVGIFARMRAAIAVIWTTMAAMSAVVWRGIALNMIAWTRLGVAGVLTIFVTTLKKLAPLLLKSLRLLTGPWGIALALITTLIYAFRDQIKQIFDNIVRYVGDSGSKLARIFGGIGEAIMSVFHMLPKGVQSAMISVVETVKAAALAVYSWFQYINPFAHHSMSLVESVDQGVDQIVNKFGELGKIKQYTDAAYSEIKRLGSITAKLGMSSKARERGDDRRALRHSGNEAAIKSYNRLQKLSDKLSVILKRLEGRITKQQAVVDKWSKAIDRANKAIDRQQKKLDRLNAVLDYYQNLLSDAEDALQFYASSPLLGMQAMEDQIHANQMAQLDLNWAIMQMEDAYGTLDEINSKLEAINGQQELLRGTQADLRSAGAGSDILNQYDEEIRKLDEQKDQYVQAARALQNLQRQLEYLQREAEKLDLVKAMKFDDLQYQIEKAAKGMKELSFDEIMGGIIQAKSDMATYGAAVTTAAAAVKDQEDKIASMVEERDRLQKRLDREEATLERLKNKYDRVNDAISAIATALSDVVEKAKAMNEALAAKKGGAGGGGAGYVSPGLANFQAAGNADFPDPGGSGMPPRTDWESQAADIDKFTDDIAKQTTDMFAQLNPFTPLVAKAKEFWGKFKTWGANAIGEFTDLLPSIFEDVDLTGGSAGSFFGKIKSIGESILEFLTDVWKQIAKVGKWAWDLFGADLIEIWDIIKKEFSNAWKNLKPQFQEFAELVGPIGEAFWHMWNRAKPVLAILVGAILLVVKIILTTVANVLVPLITNIAGFIGNIVQIIRGFVEVFVGVINGDWAMAWKGIYDIVEGTFGAIWNIIKGAGQIIWAVVSGLVEGIAGFFAWLWDVLFGHSIIPDIINAFFEWFGKLAVLGKWVWEHVLKPLYDKVVDLWPIVKSELSEWWERIKNVWNVLFVIGQWLWDNVLVKAFNKVGDLWVAVKAELAEWLERIKNTWEDLKNLGDWFKVHVMDKVYNAITGVWTDIKTFLVNNADMLVAPMKAIVNTVISAVNAVIGGINKISDVLPGDINWHIDTITPLARGGAIPKRRVGSGFKTHGARAIVGEGNPSYPEYVIPTDPIHRKRALALLGLAGANLGVFGPGPDDGATVRNLRNSAAHDLLGVPMYGIGGWLTGAIGDSVDWVKDKGREAVGAVINPVLDKADGVMHKAAWKPPAIPPSYGISEIRGWVNDTAAQYQAAYDHAEEIVNGTAAAKKGLAFVKSHNGQPYSLGAVGPNAFDCSGLMSAVTHVMRGEAPYNRIGTTGNFPWPGFNTMGPFEPKSFVIGSTPHYPGSDYGHMAGTVANTNVESSGGAGVHYGSSALGYTHGNFTERAQIMLGKGGIALRRHGGTDVTVGEGGNDEAIVPLPNGWRNSKPGGETHLHFHGDLNFPNVTDGSDAEAFINNLESMAKD